MNDLWIDKYKPKRITDIVGNKQAINEITIWLKQYKAKIPGTPRALLIIGSPGLGKSSSADIISRELGYDVIEFNASDIRSQKTIQDEVSDAVSSLNINQTMGNGKPILIIMDEVDGMSSGDKGGIAELIHIINPLKGRRNIKKTDKLKHEERWIAPIICICNDRFSKKITELLKVCQSVSFNLPYRSDLYPLINKICALEKLTIDKDAIEKIIDYSQNDIRRLIYILQELHKIFKYSQITLEKIENSLCQSYSHKNIEIGLFDAIDKLLTSNNLSIATTIDYYETDKNLVPLMIYENYLSRIINTDNVTNLKKLENIGTIIDYISYGDTINGMMYDGSYHWELQQLYGITSTTVPSYYINSLGGSNGFNKNRTKLKFPTILGKMSTYSSQRKSISNLKVKCPFLTDISSILYFRNMLFNLILSDNIDQKSKGVDLLKKLNLDTDIIEELQKIKTDDNNTNYKKALSSKSKKQLNTLFTT